MSASNWKAALSKLLRSWTALPIQRPDPARFSVRDWQDRYLDRLLVVAMILGVIAAVPSIWLSLKEGLLLVALADFVLIAFVIGLNAVRGRLHRVRALAVCGISYAIGLLLLMVLGPFGGGPLWLFAFPILTGVLLGGRWALAALSVNVLTSIVVGVLLATGFMDWQIEVLNPIAKWVVICANFVFLNSVATLSITSLLQGLRRALDAERDVSGSLRSRTRDLEAAEKKLKKALVQVQSSLHQTIAVLATAAEMRDPYTAGHQRRVTNLACAIAAAMELPEDKILGLRMAGVIHDVGKISVPAEILSKPGKLSDIEFQLIQAHVEAGYNLLKDIDFHWPVAEIIRQHHERVDGSGYPRGLLGEDICIEARILAIADTVEAMSSHRPYRAALGIDAALAEISGEVRYDPQVVNACLEIFSHGGFDFEDQPE